MYCSVGIKCLKVLRSISTFFILEHMLTKHDPQLHLISSADMGWMEARATCRGYGGHLVTISNCKENSQIFKLMGSIDARFGWIGMNNNQY